MSQVIPYPEPSTAAPAPLEPATRRIDALDLLRGLAILGILLMNTQSMSMPSLAYYDPYYYHPGGSTDLPNYLTWCILHVLADVKLLTIFSMLFGAGIVIQADRVAARGQSAAAVHYRRMLALLLIGFVHAYLIWYGDVLVSYVLCGIVLFPFRRLPPTLLLVAGVLCISTAMYVRYVEENGLSRTVARINHVQNRLYGDQNGIDYELGVYRGPWWGQLDHRIRVSLANQTTWFMLWGFWRYGGSMLIGMGLLRQRFFHGEWPVEAYRTMAATLIPLGWSITIVGIFYNQTREWDQDHRYYTGEIFNYFGSLIAAIGYMAVGVLIAHRAGLAGAALWRILTAPVRAVGRTALSNYILQALICTTLFYGHGLGWFGYLTRIQLVLIVLCVWAFQMIASMLWLTMFRQGPLEWVWHWLAHGRGQAASRMVAAKSMNPMAGKST